MKQISVEDVDNLDLDYKTTSGFIKGRDLKLNSSFTKLRTNRLDYQSELYNRIYNWEKDCKTWKLTWSREDIFRKTKTEIINLIKLHVEECFFFGDIQNEDVFIDEDGIEYEYYTKEDYLIDYGDTPHKYLCNFKLSNGKIVSIKVVTQPHDGEMINVGLPKILLFLFLVTENLTLFLFLR